MIIKKTIQYVTIFATVFIGLSTATFAQQSYSSIIAFSVNEKDLIPEGIAYDVNTEQFFLSSINKEKIVSVDLKGKHADFISSGKDGVMQSLGLKVDLERRRLWALSNSSSKEIRYSAVHIYDIDTRQLIKKLSPPKDVSHTLNDLVITNEGGAFISDTRGNSVYQVPSDLGKIDLFMKSDSLLVGPNGISISPDNTILYVATNEKGIMLIDLKNKSLHPIENILESDTKNVDGMLLYKNSLVCNRWAGEYKDIIIRYFLDKTGREIIGAEIIDYKNQLFNDPTTSVIVDNYLYCLAGTSLGVYTEKKMNEVEKLKNPTVLKYKLN